MSRWWTRARTEVRASSAPSHPAVPLAALTVLAEPALTTRPRRLASPPPPRQAEAETVGLDGSDYPGWPCGIGRDGAATIEGSDARDGNATAALELRLEVVQPTPSAPRPRPQFSDWVQRLSPDGSTWLHGGRSPSSRLVA